MGLAAEVRNILNPILGKDWNINSANGTCTMSLGSDSANNAEAE